MPETVRVGLLGFGTVGGGAYRMLRENAETLARRAGLPIEVTRIGVRDAEKPRDAPEGMVTTDLASIVDDPEIGVIVEVIGGIEPAQKLVERALANGKHVVTANKELIARHGSRLVTLARDRGLDLHYEAAVGGGIPLVQALKHQLAGNDIVRMIGILNGTSNYVLSRMEEGEGFSEALSAAQREGFAEADPSSDVDGWDTAYKISILASIAFGRQVPIEDVAREGIRGVTSSDRLAAAALGYRIKLLGIVDPLADGRIVVRVHPTLVPKSHPLGAIMGVDNALWVRGDFVGDLLFTGRGAGSDPTASAVVGDLVDVARTVAIGGSGSAIPYGEGQPTGTLDDVSSAYYLRLTVEDRPRALGEIAAAFGRHEVGLAAMEMRTLPAGKGEIVFLIHPCAEPAFRAAVADVAALSVVHRVENSLRVESLGTELGR